MEELKKYRIRIDIRQKGSPFMDGIELKTEHYEDRNELLEFINQFIDDTFEHDDEDVFMNAEGNINYED